MKLVSRLSQSDKLKKVLYWCIVSFSTIYIFSIPSFGESSSISRYLIYVSMALLGVSVFVYCIIYGDFKIKSTMLFIPAFALIAFFGTVFHSNEFREWLSLVFLSISFFIFLFAFKILKNKYVIFNIITIAFFFFSLYFIFYFRDKLIHFNSETRLGPPFDNQNGVASFAVVGFAVPLYLLLFFKRKIRFVYIVPILTSLIVGIATGSRTFFVIIFLFILIYLFFVFQKHKFVYLGVIAGLFVMAIILINLPFMDSFKQRIIAAFETLIGTAAKVDTATLERVVYVDYGFYLGCKNLILGYGVGGFAIFSGVGTYAHSNFAEVLCDFGLFGFALFYLPLAIMLVKAIVSKKVDKAFVIPFLLYYLIVSISNVLYYKKVYYLILALLFYLTYFDQQLLMVTKIVKNINKIVFTCDSMGSGGAEKVIANLSNELANRGYKIVIIGVGDTKEPQSFYKLDNNVCYKNLIKKEQKRINPFIRIIRLNKLIKSEGADVVVSFLPNANIYTFLSLVFSNVPHIVSERNNPYIDPKEKLIRLFKKISFRFADGCIFQTKDAMEYYSLKIQSKSIIIKNPVVLSFDYKENNIERKKTVLAVGRLTEQKNYHCLLDAFKIFNDYKGHTYELRIYGDGLLRDELINYSNTIGIKKYVRFLGNDSEWHKKEYDASIYVLSSDYEGMPNALAEAMALGIPSISTDCPTGGSRELINHGINGYLCPLNDPLELGKTMINLSNSNLDSISFEGRKIKELLSISNIVDMWLNYIGGLEKETYE